MKHHKGKIAAVMAVVMLVSTLIFALPASAANPRTVISGSAFGAVLEWDLPDSIETDTTGGSHDIASGQSFTLANNTAYAFDILELTAATASGSPVTASPAATTVPANGTVQVDVSGTGYTSTDGGVVLYIRYQDAASDLSGASTDYDIVHDSAYIPFEIHDPDEQETEPTANIYSTRGSTAVSRSYLDLTTWMRGVKATSDAVTGDSGMAYESNVDQYVTGNYYYDYRLYPDGFGVNANQANLAFQFLTGNNANTGSTVQDIHTAVLGDGTVSDYYFTELARYENDGTGSTTTNSPTGNAAPTVNDYGNATSIWNPLGYTLNGDFYYHYTSEGADNGFRQTTANSYLTVNYINTAKPDIGSFSMLFQHRVVGKRTSGIGVNSTYGFVNYYVTFYIYDTTALYDAYQSYGGLTMSDYVMNEVGRLDWTEYLSALAQADYYLSNENPYLDQADMDAAAQRLENAYTALTSGATVDSALRAELYGLLQDLDDLLKILDTDNSNYTPESVALFETRFATLSIPSLENWTDADAQTAVDDINYLLGILAETTSSETTTETTTTSTTGSTTTSTTESTTASTTESTTEPTTAEPDDVYKFLVEFNTFTGSEGSLTAKVDADLKEFVALYVDGEELEEDTDFTLSEGSTVITLLDTYLDSLEDGEYPVEARFTDGSAYTTLTIAHTSAEASDTTPAFSGSTDAGSKDDTLLASYSVVSPNTGDTLTWILVPAAAAIISAGILLILKRKRAISL
ncbi:MAG: LPXTG cell wall anchor domain-containing protein [Clostridiales bacterium]|nr:LPXTG cell wall anchor domain-containing protein [Clostridiales bacterium]